MSMYDVSGACDMHVHCEPDLTGFVGDDMEVAQACVNAGYKAFLIKAHHESTASRAYHVRKRFPEMKTYGSIVLNTPVGGINPSAVEIALQLGIKEIFMPSTYARAHTAIHGKPGAFGYRTSTLKVDADTVYILNENGGLKPEVLTVLELARDYNVPIGTCHLSEEEIFQLAQKGKELRAKILITHPHFHPPKLSDDALRALIELGAKIELCAATVCPFPGYGKLDQVVETIRAVGYHNFFITSDAGTPTKPMPPETLSCYLSMLLVKGVEKQKLDYMCKEHPIQIFSIED
ncbi:hypothetical protein AGMMS50276_24780 [Synergistales bacterium]|nr:hypothetical protein AGMMS50276_24780 [Synergistales bacterium]